MFCLFYKVLRIHRGSAVSKENQTLMLPSVHLRIGIKCTRKTIVPYYNRTIFAVEIFLMDRHTNSACE